MALIKAAARLIIRERSTYSYHGPVLCLGVPDIYLTPAELSAALNDGVTPVEPAGAQGFVDAHAFLAALGLREVTSVDISGAAHAPDLVHDLNRPFPADLTGRFGLVVDPGTTEHVFDIRTGLGNVVRALRLGGVVVHFVPVYSYNGGYFTINPNLLTDFYAVNGVSDVCADVYGLHWGGGGVFSPIANIQRSGELGPIETCASQDC